MLAICLFSFSAFAQWNLPAKQVTVQTSNFYRINASSNDLQTILNWLDTGGSGSALKGTNIVDAVYSNGQWFINIYNNTNFLFVKDLVTNLNYNFSLTSNDFEVLQAYLLGGSVSNMFTNVTWSTSGNATNSALVPALQYNQNITKTNFMMVNTNTHLTTNIFISVVGQMLGMSQYATFSTNFSAQELEYHIRYTNFLYNISRYVQMETGYTDLPTNLNFTFPDLFVPIKDEIGGIGYIIGNPDPTYFYGIPNATGTVYVSHTNGTKQYITIASDNVNISLNDPPEGTPFTIDLWVRNRGSTNITFTGSFRPASNASDISGKTNIAFNKYHSTPFSDPSLWYEEVVALDTGSVATVSPPVTTNIGLATFTGNTNCVVEITTNLVDGVSSRIYTFYPSNNFENAYITFTTTSTAYYGVTIIGGGASGHYGRPTIFSGGGGGGGQIFHNNSVGLAPGSFPIVIGAGGSNLTVVTYKTSPPGPSPWALDGSNSTFYLFSASGGKAPYFATNIYTGMDNSFAGKGGDSGSFIGGTYYASLDPSSAGGGASAIANGSSGTRSKAGNGAAGRTLNVRGLTEIFGSGGGGGFILGRFGATPSTSQRGLGGPGAGSGARFTYQNTTNIAEIATSGTSFGSGGGGGAINDQFGPLTTNTLIPGIARPGFGKSGAVIISHPLE